MSVGGHSSIASVQPFVDPGRWLGVLTVKVLNLTLTLTLTLGVLTVKVLGARINAREDGTRTLTNLNL